MKIYILIDKPWYSWLVGSLLSLSEMRRHLTHYYLESSGSALDMEPTLIIIIINTTKLQRPAPYLQDNSEWWKVDE